MSTDDELLAELRATDDRAEPDWAALEARIGAAIDREPSPRRRASWRWAAVGGAALAASAAIIALALAPGRARPASPTTSAVDDNPVTDDEVIEALDVPDDLGGITLDDDLLDEAAALYPDEDI